MRFFVVVCLAAFATTACRKPPVDVDITEDLCVDDLAACGPDATCTVVDSAEQCDCDEGYEDDAGSCVDIDECETDNGGCGDAAYWACENQEAGEPLCTDLDECETDNGGCGDDTLWTCTDNEGAAPTCTDIDECETDNGGCGDDMRWTCENNEGAAPTCADIDECGFDTNPCGDDGHWACIDNEGADPTCADIDECETENGDCGDPTYWACANIEGAAPTCTDIDECDDGNNGGCGSDAYWTCANNEGVDPTCTDIDECDDGNNGGCGDATYWTCADNDGADPTCTDIDECDDGNNGGCGDATYWACADNDGAAPTCTDIDECDDGNNGGCGDATYWTCADNDGADPTCTDIDECDDGNNGGCGDADFFTCANNEGDEPTCDDAECATDGVFDPAGTECDGGICAQGVCLEDVVIFGDINLTTQTITEGRICAEAPQYAVASVASDQVVLASEPTDDCLVAGDEVLLINLQGTPGTTDNVGRWELFTVSDIDTMTVSFDSAKTEFFGDGPGVDTGIGSGATDQKVMLVRVPAYDALTVPNSGSLTANRWDGTVGGVVALRAGLLTVDGGISAVGLGYRSGRWSRGPSACNWSVHTEGGESIGSPAIASTSRNDGGPGGISAQRGGSYNGNTPINPSAGHAEPGLPGINGRLRTLGEPGAAYGVDDGERLTMGSGGAGNLTCAHGVSSPALRPSSHAAGGIVVLLADTLVVAETGSISSTAPQAGRDLSASGGYVLLRGDNLTLGTDRVTAMGGIGMSGSPPTAGQEIPSSPGFVVIQSNGTVTGTANPPAVELAH